MTLSFPRGTSASGSLAALGQVGGWPCDVAAVGVLHPGGSSTVGPVDVPLPWASVTKPATALAVLVAVEEGTLRLEDRVPAEVLRGDDERRPRRDHGDGIDAPRVASRVTPGVASRVTVRHLLAHASGMATDEPVLVDPPGVVRRYSNAGFRVLGRLLAERSGLPFGTYLSEGVLEPLGMSGTRLLGGPDAGLTGPLQDLLALAGELARPTLLAPATHREMTTAAYPTLAGIVPGYGSYDPCPWGLGVEIRGTKQPHWTGSANSPATFGHFGRAGSFLWVDPDAGVAAAGLADRPFGPWAQRAWPALADALLAEISPTGREPTGPA